MIPRNDHQFIDLAPYAASYPVRAGLKYDEVDCAHEAITTEILKKASVRLYEQSKIQFTAVVLMTGAAILSHHLIIYKISNLITPQGVESDSVVVLVAEIASYLFLSIICWNVYSFIRRNDTLSPKEINICRSRLSTQHINNMNYEQFFEQLRLWEEFSLSIVNERRLLGPTQRWIVDNVTIWRNINLEHFIKILRDRVDEMRMILREKPYLYPFLVQHLPEQCRTQAHLLTRLNPLFSNSLTADLLNQLDENLLFPSEDTTTGVAASSSSIIEQNEDYFSIRLMHRSELLIHKELLTQHSSYFSRLKHRESITLPHLQTSQFQILINFLTFGEAEFDESNFVTLYHLAMEFEFTNSVILKILKEFARRVDTLAEPFYSSRRICLEIKMSGEKKILQEILDILEDKIFSCQDKTIQNKIGQFLDHFGQADLFTGLSQNVVRSIGTRIQNMLNGRISREYLRDTLNGFCLITSTKIRNEYKADLIKILAGKVTEYDYDGLDDENIIYHYPVDELWEYATQHNHEALKQLVRVFAASPEGQENLEDSKRRNGWFLLHEEMQI